MIDRYDVKIHRFSIGDLRCAKFVAVAKKIHRLHIVLLKIVLDIVQSTQRSSFLHRLYNLVLLCFNAGSINVVSTKKCGQRARRAARLSKLCFFILFLCLFFRVR